ncbi:MAG: helix-turn-helix transcriptional regulator [Bacteroidales bacterium]|nr:helix-turn-helix transcriptional regulator [Bacteroidales bacterium]
MDSNMQPSEIKVTGRELEILRLLAKGLSTPKIAEELKLGTETILWYRKGLHRKFNVHSTVELLFKAMELHII